MSTVSFRNLSSALRTAESAGTTDSEPVEATPGELAVVHRALRLLANKQAEVELADGDPDAPFLVEDDGSGVDIGIEAVAAQLQTFLTEQPPTGSLTADDREVMYDSRDALGWLRCYFIWKRNKRRHPGKWDPGPPVQIPNHARVGLLGDWGTGRYGAITCARSIARTQPPYDVLIHLGDVYYSGTPEEVQRNFLDGWPRIPGAINRACNSNHEMYAGGFGYFDRTLPSFEQPASYFCLDNEHFRLLGLDTGYADGDLAGDQAAWARELVLGAGARRVILLSHHQPFTLFKREGHYARIVEKLQPLFAERRIFAWYWGHEHRCVVYDRHPTLNVVGRCIGHSGFPYLRDRFTGAAQQTNTDGSVWHRVTRPGAPSALVLDGPNLDVERRPHRYGPNGYAALELSGATLIERVHAADGAVLLHSTFA